jgi:hypothetical protein
MGHRDYTTTLIYADFAPDPSGGAMYVERAFGAALSDDRLHAGRALEAYGEPT